MVQEARAMARLSDPNIVTVYEIGTCRQGVFIAMELVEGESMAAWLGGGARPWPSVIAVFALVARGLSAAHRAGLVHRDIKPSNILLGRSGTVLITDFGLVVDREQTQPNTHLGAGTPAYMAPEQRPGKQPSPAWDQFAFFVALYEALSGSRPFDYATVRGLPPGATTPVTCTPSIPRWLQQTLDKGLAAAPTARHNSMQAVAEALEHAPQNRRRWRLSLAAIGVCTVGGAVVGGYALRSSAHPPRPCQDAARHWQGVWQAQDRPRLSAQFGRESAAATEASDRVADKLDAYRASWITAHRDACEATHVFGEQSARRLDQRMHCLNNALIDVRRKTHALLTEGSPQLLQAAVPLVSSLPPLSECAQPQQDDAPLPKEYAAVATRLRERLADAQIARALHGPSAALRVLEATEDPASTTDPLQLQRLHVDVALLRGWLLAGLGEGTQAVAQLHAAGRDAADCQYDAALASVWNGLMYTQGPVLSHYAQAIALARVADTLVIRAGNKPGQRAKFHNILGAIRLRSGEYEAALTEFAASKQALAQDDSQRDAAQQGLAAAMTNHARVLTHLSRLDEAFAEHEQALVILRQQLGHKHPLVVGALIAIGDVLLRRGDHDAALRYFEGAQALIQGDAPSAILQRAFVLTSIGEAHLLMGQPDLAVIAMRNALDLDIAARGIDSTQVERGVALLALGVAELRADMLQAAQASLLAAFNILSTAELTRPRWLIELASARAQLFSRLGREREATAASARANEIPLRTAAQDLQ